MVASQVGNQWSSGISSVVNVEKVPTVLYTDAAESNFQRYVGGSRAIVDLVILVTAIIAARTACVVNGLVASRVGLCGQNPAYHDTQKQPKKKRKARRAAEKQATPPRRPEEIYIFH